MPGTVDAQLVMSPPVIEKAQWPAQGQWTYEDYAHLPDDGWRYEVIRGELHMTPAPNTKHQVIVRNIGFAIMLFLRRFALGEILFAPIDVLLPARLATPVQPDIIFIASSRLDIVKDQHVEGPPDLIVEVLSPTNWLDDRRTKYQVYAESGVREYWIVDPTTRLLEVFVLERGEYRLLGKFGAGERARSEILPGFELPIDEVLPL